MDTAQTKKRVCCLYRVSTKGQVDKANNDIPMQKNACHEFAKEKGWEIVSEHSELGVSGFKVAAIDRDELQQVKQEAEAHRFDILLVFMFDRLGRKENETPFVLKWFVEQGIEVWSTQEGQQRFETHVDDLLNYIRFWQASGESQKTSVRIQTRLRQIVSSGHYTGGTVPYGYMLVNMGRVNKKGLPVKDLAIEPDEAKIVREIFEKIANDGYSAYAMAQELNSRGVKTHNQTKFQTNNVLRIVRHRGYTGYITTRGAESQFISELQIIDDTIFTRANNVANQRCSTYNQARTVAKTYVNKTLLAGIVYCAHCGARMSGFMHQDRYKLRDGTVREQMAGKYNCYQRAQKLRDCDGQALYKADIVDALVLKMVWEMFEELKAKPRDKTVESKIRQEMREEKGRRYAQEKKIQDAQHRLEGYEAEIIKVIDGTGRFPADVLSRMITSAQDEVKTLKLEYARMVTSAEDKAAHLKEMDQYYEEFLGWAEEFELATMQRKRMILSELLERVEVGKGYKVTLKINLSYGQLLDITGKEGVEIQNSDEVA